MVNGKIRKQVNLRFTKLLYAGCAIEEILLKN